jgi:Xaa-Pro aminopeptidase
MSKQGIDAFLAPTDDPHMSEYTAPYYGRREYISGFTGSAGTAIITTDKALLFTDGRYHNQAELELDANYWTLMRQGLKDVPTPTEFLSQNLKKGNNVGIDATIHSATFVKKMIDVLNTKKINVKIVDKNPIDDIWGSTRPPAPSGLLRVHDIAYAGKTVSQKLTDIRQIMKSNNVYGMTVTSLDEIAWLFNIRGCDVPCNPVAVAYAIITLDTATLYINDIKVTPDVKKHLSDSRVNVSSYDGIFTALKSLSKQGKIWIDGKTANYSIYKSVDDNDRVDKDSPIILMKAKKNDVELENTLKEKIEENPINVNEKEIINKMVYIWNKVFEYSISPIKAYSNKKNQEVLLNLYKTAFSGDLNNWREYACKINSSQFLMGEKKTKNNFKAVFSWLIKEETIEKILNGEYGVGDRELDMKNVTKNIEEKKE